MKIEVLRKSGSIANFDEMQAVRLVGERVPQSFCRFASEFGYGRFGGLIIFYSGVAGHPDSLENQGVRVFGFIQEAIEEEYFEYDPDGDASMKGRLYPFAASENGEYFAWFMQEGVEGEFPIYCIGARMAGMRYAAASVDDLIGKLCGEEIKSVMGPGYQPLPCTFEGLD